MSAYVVHKQTKKLYEYLGDNIFQNVITGQKGEVPDELAKKIFAISLDATEMLGKYPHLINAIKALELVIETN